MVDAEAPKVLFLDHCARESGAELALAQMAAGLSRYVPVVVLGEEGPLCTRLRRAGVRVAIEPLAAGVRDFSRTDVGGLRSLLRAGDVVRYAHVLRALIGVERPAVVHTNSMKAHVYGALATRFTGVPLVMHVHDRISTDFMSRGGVHLMRTFLRLAPAAVVVNSRTTAATVPASARGRRPFLVLPCPVPSPVAPVERAGERRSLTFGVAGRITPWKGQDFVLRAFAAAFPPGAADHRLRIVGAPIFGEDDFLAALRRLVAELGLDRRVEFRGHVPQIYPELAEWDVLVHGSRIPEPFGQVVVEGMAAGLPVLAPDEGGPAEIIRPGETGLLYRARDEAALAGAMRRVAADPELRRRLSSRAVAAAARYDPGRVVPLLEDFYDRCTARVPASVIVRS